MKIHSNTLTTENVEDAAAKVRTVHKRDFLIAELVQTGSRKRSHGFTFKGYALSGRYATNSGIYGAAGARAAAWDAWGYFIAELFKVDPDAIIGQYNGPADFGAQCRAYQPTGYGDKLGFLSVVSQSTVSDDARVVARLREDNPNEPGAEWSIWDLSQDLNIPFENVRASIYRINPGSRYVGGTSKYLYSLPRETAAA